jgi:hypothetical protein
MYFKTSGQSAPEMNCESVVQYMNKMNCEIDGENGDFNLPHLFKTNLNLILFKVNNFTVFFKVNSNKSNKTF